VHAKLSGYALDRADAELVLAPDRLEQLHRRSSPSHSTAPARFLIALRLAGFTIDGGPFPVIEVGQIRVSKSTIRQLNELRVWASQNDSVPVFILDYMPDSLTFWRFNTALGGSWGGTDIRLISIPLQFPYSIP